MGRQSAPLCSKSQAIDEHQAGGCTNRKAGDVSPEALTDIEGERAGGEFRSGTSSHGCWRGNEAGSTQPKRTDASQSNKTAPKAVNGRQWRATFRSGRARNASTVMARLHLPRLDEVFQVFKDGI